MRDFCPLLISPVKPAKSTFFFEKNHKFEIILKRTTNLVFKKFWTIKKEIAPLLEAARKIKFNNILSQIANGFTYGRYLFVSLQMPAEFHKCDCTFQFPVCAS